MDAGVTSDGKQVLMGMYEPSLVAIFFDKKGDLLGVQERELSVPRDHVQRALRTESYEALIESHLEAWQKELAYQPETIQVHKFFVLDGGKERRPGLWYRDGIGIEDYPAHFHDVLAHPEEYTEEDRQSIADSLARWNREGQFVLWWGNDYWFDQTGECVAS